jgi:outer membrane protein assembly factor BamB
MIKLTKSSVLTGSIACVVMAAMLSTLQADDWPRWGCNDPGRNMYSPEKGIPAKFDAGKFKPNSEEVDLSTTKNVKWVAKLGSQSYGNPVAANGKVFVGTNNASPRDEKYKDDRSCLYALNEYDGSFLWQLAVPKLASGKVNDWEYLGILASPCVDNNKVYLVTSRCDVVCLDRVRPTARSSGFTI